MRGARILVVGDEPELQRSLAVDLRQRGYAVTVARAAEQALTEFADRPHDVMVVDLMLPGMDGIELTRRIRSQHAIPIIVVSAIADEQKKVEALECGADDYLTKPVGIAELAARIKSVMRRWARSHGAAASFTSGALSVDFERREVRVGGELVHLTPKEYDLLKYMIEHAGKALTHRTLLTAVWGAPYAGQAQYLRVFVGQLRKKIEPNLARPVLILTDPGVGYRFRADPCVATREKFSQSHLGDPSYRELGVPGGG